ncbi:MAG: glycoside hydrolase family 36 protein [bacterium]
MRSTPYNILALGCSMVLCAAAAAGGFMDIAVHQAPEHEIRFTSDRTIYVESLQEGRWSGRYWTADGRIDWPYDRRTDDAFAIQVKDDPSAETGTSLSTGWEWLDGFEAPPTEKGARHFVVELSNKTFPVSVRVHTLLDGTPILTRCLEITNTSEKPFALTGVYPWSTRMFAHTYYRNYSGAEGEGPFELGYFTKSDWGWEGWFDWKLLPAGATSIKCDKGQGFDDPFFVIKNGAKGEYLIGHLAWSANWEMAFEYERKDDPGIDSLRFRVGPSAVSAQRVIEPGETVQTPAVHMGLIAGDLDSAVQAMHEHLRGYVLPSRPADKSFLIQYLVPADQGYMKENPEGQSEKTVKENIDLAAAMGVELFILDAGWWDIPLDWTPSPTRFPRGLEPVIEYAHEKGLFFGLYAEIEGGRGNIPESKVAKEHPEWIGPKNIINLTIPEAAAWVESELTRLIETYNLDLFRLDYNPIYTFEGPETLRHGFMENNYWRYYEAFYDMFERIHRKFPDLILQQCSAGGARNDLGTASRFHESYLTDGLWMPNVLRSYCGQTLGLPPEILVTAFGAFGQPTRGRIGNLDTHLRSTFALSTPLFFSGMVAPNLKEMTPDRLELHRRYVNLYKEFVQPVLPTCRMYHHAPVSSRGGVNSSGWFAMEYAAPDGSIGWSVIVRIGDSDSDTYTLIPRGLRPGMPYNVYFDSLDTTVEVDGLELTQDGLSVRLESVGCSELLLFEAK